MIINPQELIKLARELISALRANTAALEMFSAQLATLEVKQDALDLEVGSLRAGEKSGEKS